MKKWNYLLPEGFDKDMQNAWNQTLVTKLNSLVKEINTPITINVSNKLKPIIEDLAFYSNNKIGDKYIVNFINEDSNVIHVSGIILEIENY